NAGTDDVGRPADREACRAPRLHWRQMGKYLLHQRVGGNRVAQETAALNRHGMAGTDDLDAQARIAAELPEDANADLHTFAVVARQLDESAAMPAEESLQGTVQRRLLQRLARRVGEAQLGELIRQLPRQLGSLR